MYVCGDLSVTVHLCVFSISYDLSSHVKKPYGVEKKRRRGRKGKGGPSPQTSSSPAASTPLALTDDFSGLSDRVFLTLP